MARVYPKALDTQWSIFVSSYTGGDYLNIGWTIYENFNIETGEWTSRTTQNYSLNCNNLTIYSEGNVNSAETKIVEISSGDIKIVFQRGEYVDFNGNVVRPEEFLTNVNTALGV